MISAGEMLFGSAPEAPQAFRGPGWENQGDILNQYLMGQFVTPEMLAAQRNRVTQLQGQAQSQGAPPSMYLPQGGWGPGTGSGPMARQPAINPAYQQWTGGNEQLNQQLQQAQRMQGIMEGAQPFYQDSRFTPGMRLAGQIQPTIYSAADIARADVSPSERAAMQASLTEATPQFTSRTPFQFQNAMQAYQFSDPTRGMTAEQMVGDAFTPQYQMAQRMAERESELQREQLANDMARRGMLTSGAMTRGMQMQQRDVGDRLANLSSQLAANQAQQMLGAQQYLQGMGWQQQGAQASEQARQQAGEWARQQSQAEEIFRQQGATDAQAQQMAQMALQRQQAAFGQQQAGRQQGISEWALQQQMKRQPMEDLFRLYQLSTGGQPGSPGSPGLIGQLAPVAGALMACLPKGTPIELSDGGTIPVDQVNPGIEVNGGTVIQVSKALRPPDHKFFKHRFTHEREVVMSLGHPHFDDLKWSEPTADDSDFTYDIKTTGGFYYVKGVKLGSTLG